MKSRKLNHARAARARCNNAFKRNEGRFGLEIMRCIRS